jgi:DNA-binding Lrp family transcriptional regulator
MHEFDSADKQILTALQQDGRLTNNELADQVGLSPSQCSRRRTRLEETGVISGYHAHLDMSQTGVGMVCIVSITLNAHNADNARLFAQLVDELPDVLEAYSLTGEMDYLLKVITRDLKSFSEFINTVLLPHESVANVKTSIVLDTLKQTSALPVA